MWGNHPSPEHGALHQPVPTIYMESLTAPRISEYAHTSYTCLTSVSTQRRLTGPTMILSKSITSCLNYQVSIDETTSCQKEWLPEQVWLILISYQMSFFLKADISMCPVFDTVLYCINFISTRKTRIQNGCKQTCSVSSKSCGIYNN